MMKRALLFGAIAGFAIIIINTISLEMGFGEQWLGFLVMFIAFSSIFVAIKQVREGVLGGAIRFSTAFYLGLGITFVASLVYVLVWEFYLALNDYSFIEGYIASLIESKQATGVTEAEMQQILSEMNTLREQYANPLIRLPMTFVEIFPVGLLVTLVSAAVLRKS